MRPPPIIVEPINKQYWKTFAPNMEMVAVGRRSKYFCPFMWFTVSGLEADELYEMQISFRKTDEHPVNYCREKVWRTTRERRTLILKSDGRHLEKRLSHPLGLRTGREWMTDGVNFHRVKLKAWRRGSGVQDDHIFEFHTMYRYEPILSIISFVGHRTDVPVALAQFIPVSHYMNPEMGHWKARINKYATKKNGGVGMMRENDENKENEMSPTPPNVELERLAIKQEPLVAEPVHYDPIWSTNYTNNYHFNHNPYNAQYPTFVPVPYML